MAKRRNDVTLRTLHSIEDILRAAKEPLSRRDILMELWLRGRGSNHQRIRGAILHYVRLGMVSETGGRLFWSGRSDFPRPPVVRKPIEDQRNPFGIAPQRW